MLSSVGKNVPPTGECAILLREEMQVAEEMMAWRALYVVRLDLNVPRGEPQKGCA